MLYYTHNIMGLFTYHPLHNCIIQVSVHTKPLIPGNTMSEPKKGHVATSWPGRDKSTNQQVCVANRV